MLLWLMVLLRNVDLTEGTAPVVIYVCGKPRAAIYILNARPARSPRKSRGRGGVGEGYKYLFFII